MPRRSKTGVVPDWHALHETVQAQAGYFTARQAQDVGFGSALLHYHVKTGKLERARRGIFRLAHYPPHALADLLVLWLWADQQAVFSHTTALVLHDLSDAMPARIHLTLPAAWEGRRLVLPKGTSAHFAELPADDRTWHDVVPVTTPLRTLRDCAAMGISGELFNQAVDEAVKRGLVSLRQVQSLSPLAALS